MLKEGRIVAKDEALKLWCWASGHETSSVRFRSSRVSTSVPRSVREAIIDELRHQPTFVGNQNETGGGTNWLERVAIEAHEAA